MKTLRVKVTPNVKVTESKKNGLYLKRFKVATPDELSVQEVKAILMLYVNHNYKLSVDLYHDNDKSWRSIETYSFQEAKEILRKLEFYYYKEISKWVHDIKYNKIADVKVSSCFNVELQEHTYEYYKIAFFHVTTKAKDIKYNPEALIEYLCAQGVECRLSVNGYPYIFTFERTVNKNHFRLTKLNSTTYSLEEISVNTYIEHETVKVLL